MGGSGSGNGGEQLGLESAGLQGVPRRLFSCTPTRLTTWSDCPRRYRFAYVDRPPPPKGPPWAHNAFGSSVHNALRSWYDLPPERRSPTSAVELVDQGWLRDGYRDDAQEAAARERARAMVHAYAEGLDPQAEPRGVERTVAFRTERVAVSGRVDRVDDRASRTVEGSRELVVVDYKTGRRPLDADHARGSLALALYVLGVRRTLRSECRRVELHHLPTATVAAWDHTEESLARHVRRAEAVADEAQAADHAYAEAVRDELGPAAREEAAERLYPASPGSMCGWCDFVRSCPEGRAAAQPQEPWAGLGREPEQQPDQ